MCNENDNVMCNSNVMKIILMCNNNEINNNV